MTTVTIKEVNDLYSTIAIYDDWTGEKIGECIEIPKNQLN